MSEHCPICCETFSKYIRKLVSCPSCHFEACMKCCQNYLLSTPNVECMSCHTGWNRDFLDATFPLAWINGGAFARHREMVLLDYEKARLPEAQYLVQNYRLAEGLAAQMVQEAQEKIQLRQRLEQIDRNRWNLSHRVHRIKESRFHSDGLGHEGDSFERRQFVRACPIDQCRGFLSSQLKCGICSTYACGECFGIVGMSRDDPHECDPNDIETAKFIKKESRPCPKCGINISKIDGCDQMFCVSCRSAFSWRTGAIVVGRNIHNPHYFELLRREAVDGQIPRQPGDNGECPAELTNPSRLTIPLHNKLRQSGYAFSDFYNQVMAVQQHTCHIHGTVLYDLRRKPTDTDDLRMRYLLGEFDEAAFKRKLVLREKAIEKVAALTSCYSAKVQSIIDVMSAYIESHINENTLLDTLKQIHTMTSEFLGTIQKRFNCAIEMGPTITLTRAEPLTSTSRSSSPSKRRREH